MPAPRTDIDRDAVAASVALVGQRETARRTGVPLGTVQRIAKAGGVITPNPLIRKDVRRITEVASVPTSGQIGTRPPHAVISDELARLGSESRISVAQYAHRTLAYVAETADADPETALNRAGDVKSVVGAAQGANVPGFERQVEQSAGAVVNIALLGMDMSALEIPVHTMLPDSEQISTNPDDY